NAAGGVSAGNRLVERQHAPFGSRVVPVVGRIAAMSGAAGDVDQAARGFAIEPVTDREPAELGRGGEIDPQRILPAVEPADVRRVERIGNKDAGSVDQRVDLAVRAFERFLPQALRPGGLGEVDGDGVGGGGAGGVADYSGSA